MISKRTKKRAFSLVELVIVILILGVLAAIAIPRISSSSKNAGESALKADLQTLRNAIDWYYVEHNNQFPAAVGDGINAANSAEALITQLTQYSNRLGVVSVNKAAAFPFGPYLRTGFPNLPAGANAGAGSLAAEIGVVSLATPLAATPVDGNGWSYNSLTGQIIANATDAGNDGKTYDEY